MSTPKENLLAMHQRCQDVVNSEMQLLDQWADALGFGSAAECTLKKRAIEDADLERVADVQDKANQLTDAGVLTSPTAAHESEVQKTEVALAQRQTLVVTTLLPDDLRDELRSAKENADTAANNAQAIVQICT